MFEGHDQSERLFFSKRSEPQVKFLPILVLDSCSRFLLAFGWGAGWGGSGIANLSPFVTPRQAVAAAVL